MTGYSVVQYMNYLICIFTNIDENVRNERKIVEKLTGGSLYITAHILYANCHRGLIVVSN